MVGIETYSLLFSSYIYNACFAANFLLIKIYKTNLAFGWVWAAENWEAPTKTRELDQSTDLTFGGRSLANSGKNRFTAAADANPGVWRMQGFEHTIGNEMSFDGNAWLNGAAGYPNICVTIVICVKNIQYWLTLGGCVSLATIKSHGKHFLVLNCLRRICGLEK